MPVATMYQFRRIEWNQDATRDAISIVPESVILDGGIPAPTED